jgi:hypothetical protein
MPARGLLVWFLRACAKYTGLNVTRSIGDVSQSSVLFRPHSREVFLTVIMLLVIVSPVYLVI